MTWRVSGGANEEERRSTIWHDCFDNLDMRPSEITCKVFPSFIPRFVGEQFKILFVSIFLVSTTNMLWASHNDTL